MFHTDLNEENVRGTLIYVNNDIKTIELNLIELIEAVRVNIKLRNNDWLYSKPYIGVQTQQMNAFGS